MEKEKIKRSKPGFKRAFAVCLFLSASLLLSACAILPAAADPPDPSALSPVLVRPQNEKYLREDEWVRMLTLAIGNPDQRDHIWEEIPASQKSGISQSDFIRYVIFLSECLPGSIISFFPATAEENKTFQGQSVRVDKHLDPKPSAASVWWLEAQTSDLRKLKLALPVTMDSQGVPFFSKSWISRQLALHDYVVLYMDALATGSRPALISLLSQYSAGWSPIRQKAAERRADELLRYYRESINLGQGSFRCLSVMPGHTVVEQQLVLQDSVSPRVRRVTFTESEGIFRAEENIPQNLDEEDGLFYLDGLTLFGASGKESVISSKEAVQLLGIPLKLEEVEAPGEDGPEFRVTWPGLIVEAQGNCDPENLTFQGKIHQVSVYYSQYETGSGLKAGDTVYDLYSRYPFAQENGYLISRSENGTTKTLAVQIESDSIVRMTLIFNS